MPTRDERKAQFKNAYKRFGSVLKASEETSIGRSTHYSWLRDDPEYKAAFEETKEDFAEKVENVMFDRIFNDPKCHHVLIIFALKGLMRDKYGDKPMETADGEEDIFVKLARISPTAKKAATVLVKEMSVTREDPLGVDNE